MLLRQAKVGFQSHVKQERVGIVSASVMEGDKIVGRQVPGQLPQQEAQEIDVLLDREETQLDEQVQQCQSLVHEIGVRRERNLVEDTSQQDEKGRRATRPTLGKKRRQRRQVLQGYRSDDEFEELNILALSKGFQREQVAPVGHGTRAGGHA